MLSNPLIRLAALRFALLGFASALVVTLLVAGSWTVHQMARQVARNADAFAPGEISADEAAAGGAASEGRAAAEEKRRQCLNENMLPGLGEAAGQALSRACEELARGDDTDKASWNCVLSMRSALRTAPNPVTVLRACGIN